MADIKDQLVKNTYNYVLQSDLSTGYVYRIGGDVPVNPIFSSGLTILDNFKYSNGTEQNGYVLYSDGSGNAYWGAPPSGSGGTVSGDYLPLSGGTVSGGTLFTAGLSANTISATTYLNLPTDIRVTGGTYSNNTFTYTNNTGGTFSVLFNTVTGLTVNGGLTVTGNTSLQGLTATTISATTYLNLPQLSGAYLPLSGGTLTGGLVANSGVTANTISQTSYIDFNTGSTNPSLVGGRVFFDNSSKALSYYDIVGSNVPIAMGQQLYTRVWNATGVQIDKGKVIAITGTSNSLPSAILARNVHSVGSDRPIGLAAENIPNGSEGLVLNNGILSGITLNIFANGDTLYLSDTVPGDYVASTSSLSFTARTNEIGYVLQTGSTNGKIYVNINNEDSNLSLTDKERNILEGNVISSGVYEYTGMTIGTGATINVSIARGWIVRNTYEFATLPDVTSVYYTGGTNIPLTNLATADATFILINTASTLVQQTTFPTPQQRRENIFLGKVVHPSRNSITSVNQTVDFDVSPMAALRDLWTPLKLINQGIIVSPHSTNLEINTSAGVLWGNGIGWTTNQQNPDSVSISGTSPTTFQYRTQLGPLTGGSVTTGNTTTIAPGFYDNNGVVTAVGGGTNSSTNQRVFLFPTGLVRIQLGQKVYGTLAEAVAGSQTEQFTEYSLNRENGILIGIISVNKNATNLSLAAQAVFNLVSKFGEVLGGTGGLSTTTLQQAYDNSVTPEIVTNSAEGALSIQNGTGNADNITNLFEGKNTATSTTSFIRANGDFSGSTYYGNGSGLTHVFNHVRINNTPQFSANTNTFINFSGVNVNIVSGTNNTLIFSAGTGGGNPSGVDVFVTGGTYNGGQLLFTNNTGGTFTVTGVTASGLSANYYGSFSDTTNQPVSGANTATVWRLNTTELSNGISISGGSRIQVANKGIYEIGYSAQIEKTQGTSANVTIWARVNGNDVDRSSSTLGLVSNSVLQLPFVSYILDLNANDYVEFYFSSDNQDVQLTTLSGLVSPTRPVSPSLIVVAKQVGLSAGNSFTGGTVSGATNFVGGLSANTISATTYQNLPVSGLTQGSNITITNNGSGNFTISSTASGAFTGGTVTGATNFTGGVTANTISATTITADDTPKVIYRLPNAVNVGNTTATTVTTITTFDITGLQVGMTIVADGLFSSTSNANQKTYQLSLSGAASNPTVTTTTGGHRAQLLMRIQGSNTIRMSLANAFGATAINPVFVDVTGSAGVFTFVARCTVNGAGGGVPVNTLESLTLTRF